MRPQSHRIGPIFGLPPGYDHERRDNSGSEAAQDKSIRLRGREYFRHAPGDEKVDANLGQISVAIGMSLQPDLNQADDRDKHPNIPKPPGKEIGILLAPEKGANRDSEEEEQS